MIQYDAHWATVTQVTPLQINSDLSSTVPMAAMKLPGAGTLALNDRVIYTVAPNPAGGTIIIVHGKPA